MPDEIIDALDEDSRRAHDAVLDRANTHIAHRVSDAEQGRVILMLNNPALGPAVAGISWATARYVGPSGEDAQLDAENATRIADSIGAFLNEVQTLILEEMKEHDLGAIYAAARPMGEEPAPAQSGGSPIHAPHHGERVLKCQPSELIEDDDVVDA